MGVYKNIGHLRSQCNTYYVSISSIFDPFKFSDSDYSISKAMEFLFCLHI